MPLPDPASTNCVSNTIEQLENEGYPHDQAVAIAMDHCNESSSMSDENDTRVYKQGVQSEEDPFTFVLSTDSPDRAGDIVEQDFSLQEFRRNPIALWGHDAKAPPIGNWANLRREVVGGVKRTLGRLNLANPGTSSLIDTLRSLVEQRILRAVSIGFLPHEYEVLDEENPWGGLRLFKNELMECSLCSVPMNADALSVAKSMSSDVRSQIFTETGDPLLRDSAAKQLGIPKSRDSGDNPKPQLPERRTSTMSLSDKIEIKQADLNGLQDQMVALEADLAEGDIPEEVSEQIEELAGKVDKTEADLKTLKRAEQALAVRAVESKSARDPAASAGTGGGQYISTKKTRKKGQFAIATLASLVKAHCNKTVPTAVAESFFKDDPEVALLVKAATDPATMTDAAWAGNLVQETWGEFLELIRDLSIYPNLPGLRLEFDRYGKINIPKNVGRGQLAGGFVAEGAPIPVKEGAYGTTDLQPFKMAVLSTFTREIGQHSMPAIQGLIQDQILGDTAELLDTLYLDAEARSGRPAGLQDSTETGAGNLNAATGGTAAAINADLKAMISRFLAARAGNNAVWIMSRINVLNLRMVQDAASGEFVFRTEVDNGSLLGFPLLVSQNIADDLVILQGSQAVAFANDYAPLIDVSDEATIVFDDTAPDHVLPDTNTQPAKSMFQTLSIAVRMHMALDWRIVRQGGIQVCTGVSWE